MHVVLLDHPLQLFVLATHLLQILWIQTLFREVDEDTPTPVLLLKRVIHRLDLDANEAARHQEWYDVLWLADNAADLSSDFLPLNA